MSKRLERVLVVPQWEHRGAEGWALYGEEEDGQIVLLGTKDIGPFDKVTELVVWMVRCIQQSGYQLI